MTRGKCREGAVNLVRRTKVETSRTHAAAAASISWRLALVKSDRTVEKRSVLTSRTPMQIASVVLLFRFTVR